MSGLLGHNLQRHRHAMKLSQRKLADRVGIDRAAISHYELNRREPDIRTLIKLANYFDVSLDDLVGRSNV
ncbi:helix-turn-helix domain-containing protein [Gorillibacterium sp. sgz5001074]|uniref:helix-turn-helix domain-containing protein n=1 Tax=Gorillibacterium sp. sgz5001074 TaxID=3446695 RepID=UPI003F67AB32